MKIGDINPNALAMAAGLGLGLVLVWQLTKGAKVAAKAIGEGAAYAGDVITGAEDPIGKAIGFELQNNGLGAWFFELLNPDVVEAEKRAIGATPSTQQPGIPAPVLDGPTFNSVGGGYFYPW